ncbi:regulator [Candidatus Pandoraea novymonadis]|uniref:Cofactor-independent phosphoglycerate mutase n=1 Tax=Candidatus Pandoraea novymonadis TaxID=1808959 RepID=A0ABX5FFV3_9BURK|nr:regulator [Candidatus Pandoraea novymonadis]PSB92221.1 hypothetical protein BZL35_00456 [Candidatus Pandoraea novymonadis]
MNTVDLHFLLPFSVPAAAHLPILLDGLKLPTFERLLARSTRSRTDIPVDPFISTLPHERWLGRIFGIPTLPAHMPLAPFMLIADTNNNLDDNHFWYCAQPAHIQINTDHLVLTDPSELALETIDTIPLFEIARDLFAEHDVKLVSPRPDRWYLSGPMLDGLVTASPERVAGRNIDIWLPKGNADLIWRKLQNEVQMAWHHHSTNHDREIRELPPINTLWLYGGGKCIEAERLNRPFKTILSDTPVTHGLAIHLSIDRFSTDAGLSAARGCTLIQLDILNAHFISGNWTRWRDSLSEIESKWLAPALAMMNNGQVREITLTLCGDIHSVTLRVRTSNLCKFWRRQPLINQLLLLAKLGE